MSRYVMHVMWYISFMSYHRDIWYDIKIVRIRISTGLPDVPSPKIAHGHDELVPVSLFLWYSSFPFLFFLLVLQVLLFYN